MRKFFSKIISIMLMVSIVFSSFSLNIINVHAEGEHKFLLKAYDWNTFDNDWEGSGTGDELTNNADVEPGKVIQLSIYYIPGTGTDMMMQMAVKYDSNLVEPMYDEGSLYLETDMSTTYQGGIWPAVGTSPANKKKTNWTVSANDAVSSSLISILAEDNAKTKTLETEGVIASVYFKIKDTATAGSVIKFEYDNSRTKLTKYDNGTERPVITEGLTLNVFGEMSSNTLLNTLNVKSDTNDYALTPAFVSGSNVRDFSTVVPNSVSSVNISATPLDSYTTIISGTGNQNLNVGDNTINMVVQAQNGDQEIYKIKVYRLNNDATLKDLSLTNGVNIGTFSSSKTTYTALVPYATKSSVVSATATDSNATIEGTGNFEFSNYGTTVNTKNITVKAENCNSKYASVLNNTCTTNTYKIDVSREDPSSNTNLKEILINGTKITGFSSLITDYTLDNVDNDVTSINVNATVEDTGKATITTTLGNKSLNVGDNEIIITVKAEDGSTKDYKVKVRRLSNDSKLSSLNITSTPAGTLSPAFTSTFYDYYTYTAPSTATKVQINGIVNDTLNAKIISGNGEYEIDTTPSVNIVVQAEDGSTSIYVVKLVRSKSTNNNLSSLGIDGYTLNETFNKSNTLYTANVSGEVTSIDVSATVEDSKATIVSGLGEHDLKVGANTIQVRVQAENGSTKDYTITVTRAKKTVSSLTDIKVDGVSIADFKEDKLEYTLDKVPFEKTKVNIEATVKDSDSTVTGTGDVNLNTGANKLHVTVVAQDGFTKKTYTINIERAKEDNTYLSAINVDGKLIDGFDKTKTSYNLTVPNNVTSLNLNATKEGINSVVSITGNENFVTTKVNKVNITVTSEAGNTKTYEINVTREKSSNNYLKDITLSTGLLNPVFNKETNSYTVDVDKSVTSITVNGVLEDQTASYEVTGPSTLIVGKNTFTITVTAENDSKNVYTVIVNRNPSSNNYLSSLTVDGTLIEGFNKEQTLYTINVDSTKSSIIINGVTEDASSTLEGAGSYNLVTGVNTISLVVTAENKKTKTYSVVVNKAKSNNSYLKSLSISEGVLSPTFNESILEYSASVAYEVTSIDITAIASDSKSVVTGDGSKDLKTGENIFEILVTSENNTTTTYKLKITRAKNDNANLSNILISGGFTLTPKFNSSTTEYSLLVPNSTDNLVITAYKQDPNAVSVKGDGNIKLETGENIINIEVTAENGITKKTYKLNITREKSSDATLKSLTVDNGTLTPEFDKDTLKYEVIVPYEIENLGISAITNSDRANYTISGNTNLVVGKNESTLTVTAEDGSLLVYTINILRQPSTNNFLQSLSVKDKDNKEYIETFLKTKMDYNITVKNDIDKITINGTLDSTTSKVKGFGEKKLSIGDNSFEVTVTSESGIERVYAIKVTREANSNNYLSSLEVEGYTINPTFNKNTLSYTLTVPSTVDSVNIIGTAEVSTSTITGLGVVTLESGVNNFNIDVTSESGESKTYVITITKEASGNNYLSNLTINPGELVPEFNKDTLEYNVHVDNATKIMTITAEKEHPKAVITGDGVKSLVVGSQKFNIDVAAENNVKRTYTINVLRDASSNKNLSDLKIDGVTVEGFNKDELKYSLNVENEKDKINIEATLEDETASVTGIGDISLKTGENILNVTVTAEDGSVKVYEIAVTRAKSNNNYLKSLSVNEGTISPEFSKNNLTYNITVPYEIESLKINAQAEDSTAEIEIDGNNNFTVGSDNKVYVNVVAEDKTVRAYLINVTRQPQVNNYLTDIVITDNDGTRYSLSPEFEKNTLNYEVELSSKINEVNIVVTKSQNSLTVTGDGKVNITGFPQTHKITVSTTGGLERTYTIKFTKGLSTNKYLSLITVDKGTLSPTFSKTETAYNVDLEEGINEITITAIKDEESQIVTGDGTKKLVSGRNAFKIIVTSESGETNVYNIFVNVGSQVDNVLDSITVDKGTLSPVFNKDTKIYTVDLTDETDITISATGKNKITGTGTFNLKDGANVFEITTTDSNNKENTYRVVVNKGDIVSSYLAYLKVPGYTLDPEFNKETLEYNMKLDNPVSNLEVIAIPESKSSKVDIKGNNNLVTGNNKITIAVTDSNNETKTYTLNVFVGQTKITSNIHTITDKYITTIKENSDINTVISEMTNPKEYLKIYDLDDKEVTSGTAKTGYKIKLIINGTEYDSKILIIKGDINSDGEVTVADIIKFRLYILETTEFNEYELVSSDVNNDDNSEVSDLILIRKHILGNYNIFAKEGE